MTPKWGRVGDLLPEQVLWQTALADHRFERSGFDFVAEIVRSEVDVAHLAVHHASITPVAAVSLSVQHESMSEQDLEELPETAAQAGQRTSKLAAACPSLDGHARWRTVRRK